VNRLNGRLADPRPGAAIRVLSPTHQEPTDEGREVPTGRHEAQAQDRGYQQCDVEIEHPPGDLPQEGIVTRCGAADHDGEQEERTEPAPQLAEHGDDPSVPA